MLLGGITNNTTFLFNRNDRNEGYNTTPSTAVMQFALLLWKELRQAWGRQTNVKK